MNIPGSKTIIVNPNPPIRAGYTKPHSTTPQAVPIELLARMMDSIFQIPGTKLRFGLDSLLGLIPGLGDTVTSLVSLYILQEANRRGVSKLTMARMAANIMIDFGVGTVPIVGDVFDVFWKSNQKNIEILKAHTETEPGAVQIQNRSNWLFFAGLAAVILVFLVGCMFISYWILYSLASLLAGATSSV